MTISGLCHVNLRAPRPLLEALRDFYVDVLGLVPGPRPALRSAGYWLYAGGKDVLHLSEAAVEVSPSASANTSFNHVAFACNDLAEVTARLDRAGVAFTRNTVPASGRVQIFLTDPAGNGVELGFAGERQLHT